MHKPLYVENSWAPSETEHHGKPSLLRGKLELPINFPQEKENRESTKMDIEAAATAAERHKG